MDGELWAGRARFEEATSTVRQQVPNDAAWRRIRFMVFDLPAHPGHFEQGLTAYQVLVRNLNRRWVVAVPQEKVISHAVLGARLQQKVRAGGKGLMLHRGDSPYRGVRSHDLIKRKTQDARRKTQDARRRRSEGGGLSAWPRPPQRSDGHAAGQNAAWAALPARHRVHRCPARAPSR